MLSSKSKGYTNSGAASPTIYSRPLRKLKKLLSLFIPLEIKLIVFTVNEHENICIARVNRRPERLRYCGCIQLYFEKYTLKYKYWNKGLENTLTGVLNYS
jgi:hypothetical protein